MRGSRARSAHVCTVTPFAPDGALDDAGRVRAGLEALGLAEWALVS
jgi:hypothetical protein